ncbi:MAG: hypothetical protein WKF72_07665 [Nocardioidaceae bacterium]
MVTIVLLLAVALVEAAYLYGPWGDDPVVGAERPVLIGKVAHRTAVDTAAQAAVEIVARSYKTYDKQVEVATARMTTSFTQEYRQTTDEIREEFIAAETVVTVEVSAQAVMTASPEQVQALLFLNQFTDKRGEDAVYTPYRVLVTVVSTDQGWLVSDIETR